MSKTIFIAEAGVNHNGSIALAKKLIDVAKKANADFVKFQTSIPELHISKFARKANYQLKNNKEENNQLQMVKKLILTYSEFKKIKKYCKKKKIEFLSTPFDLNSIDFLKNLGMKYFKIPSGEITNMPYLVKVGKLKKKIILSTGMASMKEIGQALQILISNGTKKKDITVLQCNTEYPTPIHDANIKAMLTMRKKFKVQIGYSDHTEGFEAALAAVALGATVIEKHFTINKKLSGPDHQASVTGKELKEMVKSIKKVSVALGDGIKKTTNSEKKNMEVARNSIVALKNIKKGEKFTTKNLTVKRPGNGISPMKFFKTLGKKSKYSFSRDELIKI